MTIHRGWLAAVCLVGCQQELPPPPTPPAPAAAPQHVVDPPPHVLPPKVVEQPTPQLPVRLPAPPLQPPEPVRPPITHLTRWFRGLSVAQRRSVTKVCQLRAADPCGGLLRPWGPDHPDPAEPLLATLSEEQRDGAFQYCEHANRNKPRCNTPLVIAFDAQPIAFVEGGPAFAFRAGEPTATDWPTAATPWLAIDRDGDGAITSGAELFGDATALPGGTARDGFAALAALDANGDGTIDARDPAFASLVLWSDRDGDHRSSPDELRPLAEVVTAIPLAHTRAPRCTDRGDCEGERGLARWRDEAGVDRTAAIVDIYLRSR